MKTFDPPTDINKNTCFMVYECQPMNVHVTKPHTVKKWLLD